MMATAGVLLELADTSIQLLQMLAIADAANRSDSRDTSRWRVLNINIFRAMS